MNKNKYGLQVEGNIRVFRSDKEIKNGKKTYTVSDFWFNVSEREENGNYFNKSMNLIFKKDAPRPDNNTLITIQGFPMITGEGKYRRISIMIMDWVATPEQESQDLTPAGDENTTF